MTTSTASTTPFRKRWRIALAALSGVLYWAAFPGVDLWPLAFLCWAPLLIALHRQSARSAALLGMVAGLTTNLAGFHWLLGVIRGFTSVGTAGSALLMIAICGWNGGRVALLAWLHARATRQGWSGAVFVLALAASEVAYPLLFPWYAAAQLHSVPLLIQVAELGGPILVGVLAAGSSLALAEVGWARLEARAVDQARIALALLAPASMVLFGVVRMPQIDRAIEAAPHVRVGIVQGNLDQAGKKHASATTIHRAATAKLQREKLDLVVWPETAISKIVPTAELEAVLKNTVVDAADGAGPLAVPILSGAIVRRSPGSVSNSAVLFEPSGKIDGIYDKVHPLAFGEYLPLEGTFPSLRSWMPNAGDVAPGKSLDALVLGDHRITVLICYEDILADHTNDAVRAGDPDLLVNLTNDVWFGDSAAPRMHYALSKLRAVEHRRFLVRASNTGVSGFIDPAGRAFGETPMMQEAVRTGELRWMRSRTLYERAGDKPWWLAALVVLAMGFVSPEALRRRGERVVATRRARSRRSAVP